MVPVAATAIRRRMMVAAAFGIAAVIAVIAVFAAVPRGSTVELDPEHVVVAVFRNAPEIHHSTSWASEWGTGSPKACSRWRSR
jgi:hypothetical protein